MKIILQSEARTISNRELAKNQKDLIEFVTKITHFKLALPKKVSERKTLS